MHDPSGLEPGGQDETMTDQRRISTYRASDGVGENLADPGLADRGCTPGVHPAVLFLDIDGVLNSAEWMRAGHMRCLGPEHDVDHFAPHLCARLERVLAATACAIVLSSSWRVTHAPAYIERILRERGAPSAKLIGATPTWRTTGPGRNVTGVYERRGHEIQAWLDEHPEVIRFAIVDDTDDMAHLMPRLVRTPWEHGMQDRHVERLIAMLSETSDA